MKVLYNTIILIYTLLIRIASLFNIKARLWIKGRVGWEEKLASGTEGMKRVIWFHCASLGEFEQGRPVMELIREQRPEYSIVLSFFSPSGYEIRKNWNGADYVCYLPADTPGNARKFVSLLRPEMAFMIKYEFWYNYIKELSLRKVPVYLVSGIFRKDQHFFAWYGIFFRKMLRMYTEFFVQDSDSESLLRSAGFSNVTLTGDTRFDRVRKIALSSVPLPAIEEFTQGEKVLIAGSSWEKDEEIITRYINNYPGLMKWIIAPHETDEGHIERIQRLLNLSCVRLSQYSSDKASARVMIIDSVGLLSSAYRYAYLAVIGGGFGKGIHNILEAACWGVPVLFGPNHGKFREATDLLKLGAAFCFTDYEHFADITGKFLNDRTLYEHSSAASVEYVMKNSGATGKITDFCFNKVINN